MGFIGKNSWSMSNEMQKLTNISILVDTCVSIHLSIRFHAKRINLSIKKKCPEFHSKQIDANQILSQWYWKKHYWNNLALTINILKLTNPSKYKEISCWSLNLDIKKITTTTLSWSFWSFYVCVCAFLKFFFSFSTLVSHSKYRKNVGLTLSLDTIKSI